MCGPHGIGESIGGVEGAKEEVACGYALVYGLCYWSSLACHQFDAISLISFCQRSCRIFIGLGREIAQFKSSIAACPYILVLCFAQHLIPGVITG